MSFYQNHLEKVSRSFCFCIIQLTSPAKEWVALSYLLCRIADIIEDSIWPDSTSQYKAFQQLKSFLTVKPDEATIQSWLRLFPIGIPDSEANLLADISRLLSDLQQLPPNIRHQLITTIIQMMSGMEHFLRHHKKNHQLILPTLTSTNQYCFFVAGIIGELLCHIFTYLMPTFIWTDSLLNQSLHFGLFLQKINLLKDQAEDKLEGRCYISSRSELRDSLIINAQESINYIVCIPIIPGRNYRLFCAWSLFIGLASLKWMDKSWKTNQSYKLSRSETLHLIDQINQLIDDNHALVSLFNRYHPGEGHLQHQLTSSARNSLETHQDNSQHQPPPLWFTQIYPCHLTKINHQALGTGGAS